MPAQSGIYCIKNTVTGKVYVGSSLRLKRRLGRHKTELSAHIHPNEKLQRAWDKYGHEAFIFSTLEVVEKQFLLEREQFWIDSLSAVSEGYNICPKAYSCAGRILTRAHIDKILEGRKGYRHSPETRAKISAFNTGRKRSPEHIASMSRALKGKPKPSWYVMKCRFIANSNQICRRAA